jgi:hypothetical protein
MSQRMLGVEVTIGPALGAEISSGILRAAVRRVDKKTPSIKYTIFGKEVPRPAYSCNSIPRYVSLAAKATP